MAASSASVKLPLNADNINAATIIQQANELNQQQLRDLLQLLAQHYYNQTPLLSDSKFDELQAIYEAKYGPYEIIGAEASGEKVDLPYFLASLRKIKSQKEVDTWLNKYHGPYIIEDKIDGLTLLLVWQNGEGKLYTRGGGTRGMDVSHLLNYLHLPKLSDPIAVRGEIVLPTADFTHYATQYKNARNLVSGVVNAKKSLDSTLAGKMIFVAYRIMNTTMKPSAQITYLQQLGFAIPNPVAATVINKDILSNYLRDRKVNAPYEIDGLVVYQDDETLYPSQENPRHVIAFKVDTETAITTVNEVVWEASKDGYLKPVIYYQPVVLSGATLQKATGYNARFIILHGIGPGAEILITRSGDVIPKVLTVIKPASQPSWPNPDAHGAYTWNTNQVELVLTQSNKQVLAARMEYFLQTLQVKNFGPARVMSLVDAGIENTVQLMQVDVERLKLIPGIGQSLAEHMVKELKEKTAQVELSKLMKASGVFPGVGEKRFAVILQHLPQILNMNTQQAEIEISKLHGFDKLAGEIAQRLPLFLQWLTQHPQIKYYIAQKVSNVAQSLQGKIIVFSGFRDGELQKAIEDRGGIVRTNISSKTNFLIMKDINERKGKALKAIKLGTSMLSRGDFLQQYISQ